MVAAKAEQTNAITSGSDHWRTFCGIPTDETPR